MCGAVLSLIGQYIIYVCDYVTADHITSNVWMPSVGVWLRCESGTHYYVWMPSVGLWLR